MSPREFEFKYGTRALKPFLLFAAIWNATAFVATLIWPTTVWWLGDTILAQRGHPAAVAVIFISAPVIWMLLFKKYGGTGKAIMYSDRVVITLEDVQHEILYRQIKGLVWGGDTEVNCGV